MPMSSPLSSPSFKSLYSPLPSLTSPGSPRPLLSPSSPRRSVQIAGITVIRNKLERGTLSIHVVLNGQCILKLPFPYDFDVENLELPLRWPIEPYLSLQEGSHLMIKFCRRRIRFKTLAKASFILTNIDDLNLTSGSEQFQGVQISSDPIIILDVLTKPDLERMLDDAVRKAGELESVLDHLGKAKKFLKTVIDLSVAISELNPAAKAILACVSVIYDKLKVQDETDKLIFELAERMARTLSYIADAEQFARLAQLRKAIAGVQPLIQEATTFILKYTSRGEGHVLSAISARSTVEDLYRRFDIFQQQFDRGLAVQSGATVETLLSLMGSFKDDQFLEQLRPRGLNNSSTTGTCMHGTREDIFEEVDNWLDDFKAPNILWIKGFPGVGKSAIASTLTQKLRVSNRLGSSYVFERAKVTLCTPNALWRSVAFDLSRLYPAVRRVVIERLEDEDVDVNTSNVQTLFRNLIEEPLLECTDIPLGRLPVVIVDALDECGGREGRRSPHREGLLFTLQRWAQLSSRFKLIVTSREEDDIERQLSGLSHSITVSSGYHVNIQAVDDIRLFLTARFAKVTKDYSDSLPESWPGEEVIGSITDRAAGLFIWAKTVTEFVEAGEPNSQLRQILNDSNGLGDMAELYAKILDISFRLPSFEVIEAFKDVVGAIVLAKRPLSRKECVQLLSLEPTMLDFIRKGLASVMDSGDILRFSHQSFVDFLLDKDKCPEMFQMEESIQHRKLVLACLRVMKDTLRFNIAGLETSYVRNSDIPNLAESIGRHVPQELQYSCRFWVDHLQMVPYESSIWQEIKSHFYENLLFWFEVLSLTNDLNHVGAFVSAIMNWGKEDEDLEFFAFLKDSLKFIAAYGGVMSQSVPHIYLSALPFAPSKSLVANRYLPMYPGTLQLESGRFSDWPAILFVVEAHDETVNSVVFSPDGSLIASGSSDKTISIWDGQTGDLISGPFEGHEGSVNSVMFSTNGRCVASGSDDMTIRIWLTDSGYEIRPPLEGHTNAVTCICYSSDDRHLVSGSLDKTVRLWSLDSETPSNRSFCGHSGGITSVAFSLDGRYIASGSLDRTIRIWDPTTGTCIAGPFEGHRSWITCVRFSPDNVTIASASDDETIQLWSIATGEASTEPFEGHTDGVTSIAFSRDGSKIVSGSHDETLRVWDVNSGEVIAGPFMGHTNGILSVGFSSDDRRLLSGSRDWTLRIWDAEAHDDSAVSHSSRAHTDGVNTVAFSPDDSKLVSGSDDDTVRIWHSESGLPLSPPLKGHSSWVDAVAYSPDGRYIASGSDDQNICIWDITSDEATSYSVLHGHRSGITSLAFSPVDNTLVSGSYDQTIRIWNVDRGELILGPVRSHNSWVTSVSFSEDGKMIGTGSHDRTIRILDALTGNNMAGPFIGHTGAVKCIAFSHDGIYIASGSVDSTIRVFNIEMGSCVLGPLDAHTGIVASLCFSLDDRYLASGSGDRTIRIWEIPSGLIALGPLEGHAGTILSVSFSNDGSKLVSGSEDETIRVWKMDDLTQERQNTRSVSSLISFDDNCRFQNGWVVSAGWALLFWVPPWNRSGLWWPRNTTVIAEVPTRIDLQNFKGGSIWTQCRSS
ncbi:WD40-repeat-containing domain protein [Cyathus striatus]|nr:WD40-repeat-containing domain protein [Cyathus striatus]